MVLQPCHEGLASPLEMYMLIDCCIVKNLLFLLGSKKMVSDFVGCGVLVAGLLVAPSDLRLILPEQCS